MMLTDMAFTRDQAIKALKETDNNVERAVDWIFNHPNDLGGDVEDEPGTSKFTTAWENEKFTGCAIRNDWQVIWNLLSTENESKPNIWGMNSHYI